MAFAVQDASLATEFIDLKHRWREFATEATPDSPKAVSTTSTPNATEPAHELLITGLTATESAVRRLVHADIEVLPCVRCTLVRFSSKLERDAFASSCKDGFAFQRRTYRVRDTNVKLYLFLDPPQHVPDKSIRADKRIFIVECESPNRVWAITCHARDAEARLASGRVEISGLDFACYAFIQELYLEGIPQSVSGEAIKASLLAISSSQWLADIQLFDPSQGDWLVTITDEAMATRLLTAQNISIGTHKSRVSTEYRPRVKIGPLPESIAYDFRRIEACNWYSENAASAERIQDIAIITAKSEDHKAALLSQSSYLGFFHDYTSHLDSLPRITANRRSHGRRSLNIRKRILRRRFLQA
jgi:hypothetical protein